MQLHSSYSPQFQNPAPALSPAGFGKLEFGASLIKVWPGHFVDGICLDILLFHSIFGQTFPLVFKSRIWTAY